ncbi:restriction endonuclease subunit S [Roseiconus lacunae]|uniref:restriction endonuclease subunit S n=1 Tax=Roseiconus lacunae TaxID=2605694 RepID=UPI001E42B8BC|nr:restriction endonuclease subunit S [Roseiconus lacunae]MCD0458673.1 restriction endonuclease subunit S [Roseiconus lacunae]
MNGISEWTSYALGSVAPASSNALPDSSETVWNLSLEDIEPTTGRVLARTHCKVSDLGSAKCSFDSRHVLYSKLRPYLNKVVLPEDDGVGTSELIPMLPDEDRLDRQYLAFYLRSPLFLSFANANTRGANLPRIAMKALWAHEIPAPTSIDEQRRIVRRIRECLQPLDEIKSISESLVSDYEALKLSVVSRVITSLKDKYPSRTIGEIVGDDRDAMRSGPFGSAMKHGEFVDEGNLVIGIANVKENRFDPVRKWMITDEKFDQMSRYEVQAGDLLITIMGTIGRTCVVPDNIGRAITSKHVYRIRFPRSVCSRYVSFIVNYDFDARRQLYGSAIGGVMPGLNATKLRNLRICVPPRDVQEKVADQLEEMHGALTERDSLEISSDLQSLRESVLNRAFAGEL